MQAQFTNHKKWKHGSVAVVLTAAVIAAVIILNVLVTALDAKLGLFIDLTAESLYTLTDDCKELLAPFFDDFDKTTRESNPGVGAANDEVLAANATVLAALPAYLTQVETLKGMNDFYKNYTELFDLFLADTAAGEESLGDYYADYLEEYKAAYDTYYAPNSSKFAVSELTAPMEAYNEAVTRYNRRVGSLNDYINRMNRLIKRANQILDPAGEHPETHMAQLDKLTLLSAFGEATVDIIFCTDADVLTGSYYQNLVYQTALELQTAFPDVIRVQCVNIYNNPSAVQKFKATDSATISTSDVIITSGTEYRLYGIRNFFTFDSTSDSVPWAYNGEKYLATGILAVTRAQSPICCLTTNHGETAYDYELLYSLTYGAGYRIQYLDLQTDEIPDDCRLMLCFNPQGDFVSFYDYSYDSEGHETAEQISEIRKLDDFMNAGNSFLLFVDAYTPEMPNLEEYMEEWGLTILRSEQDGENYNYLLKDHTASLTSNGTSIVADYVDNSQTRVWYSNLLESSVRPKVIFKNATALGVPETVKWTVHTSTENRSEESIQSDDEIPYTYYSYTNNGINRYRFNIFDTGASAYADAAGSKVDETGAYNVMALSFETDTEQTDIWGGSVSNNHYFGVIASTEFVAEDFLQSTSFGNTDVILLTLRLMSRETVPVSLKFKPFADTTIDSITTRQIVRDTLLLTLIPATVAIVAGVFIMVRRKYA